MKKQNGQKKRGRKPKRDIRDKDGLVAEVKAEIAAIDPEHKLKNPPVEKAIANCLRHDTTTQPRSWWWMEDLPLGPELGHRTILQGSCGPREARPARTIFAAFRTCETLRD